MEFLSQTYVALRGPTGQPQTPADTIGKLSDRLSPATLLADRRASVLALKGLARDCKEEVGDRALPGLLEVFYNDSEVDADIGKAVLETLYALCDTEDPPGSKELGYKHTDFVLANEKLTHSLFSLLGDTNFYTRFSAVQYLLILLRNRRQAVQGYFLTAPAGPGSVIKVLEDKREIIRNGEPSILAIMPIPRANRLNNLPTFEAINMIQGLISQSPDIQKVLAFEGAFERLFDIISQEGGVDGGVVAHLALSCVDSFLRFNTSNQGYFRETTLPPTLCALLQFPATITNEDAAPQEFALQFWDDRKQANTSLVIGIMGMLIGSKGNGPRESSAFTRCFIEMALASNAPTSLKTQALRLLPTNITFPLSEIFVTPYVPVPETNGEEWDRLESASALDVLVELTIHGEYNEVGDGSRTKHNLELRTVAATVFENFVRKEEIRLAIVETMLPHDQAEPPRPTPLLHALASPPNTESALDPANVISTHLATLLFAHLLRSSSRAKTSARLVVPGLIQAAPSSNTLFVPADGAPLQSTPVVEPEDDEAQTLLQVLTENLSLSLLSRSRANTSDKEAREWDRYVVGYLCLLSQWLWEDPKSIRDFLEAGGLGVLVEPINQTSEVDSIVPGLCAFLLGICYEYNREPGEITRSTIHPIISRLGVETLMGQMARFREDERFKSVGPDSIIMPYPTPAFQPSFNASEIDEVEVWFDWAFVDFWKSNYYTVQRGFSIDPDQLSPSSGQSAESAMLIASLRDVIRQQSVEIEALQTQLKDSRATSNKASDSQLSDLQNQVKLLQSQLETSEGKRKDVEKEQEDLLVLLDEVTSKRRKDKVRLREANLEVSEDEAEEDDGDEDE